jgi:prepilin-type processing-associated H-X9-DG protein
MNHKNGINITYADGHSEFVRLQYPENIMELERFRWDIEGTQFPLSAYKALNDSIQAPPSFPKSIIGLGIVTFVVGVILLYAGQAWKHPSFALILAVGASVVGFVFGGWGESLYRPEYFKGIGTYGGAALGFLAGLCYVGILTKLQLRFKIRTSVNQLALSLGIASGLLCSALLHLALAIAHHNYFIIMLGIPFGILGGAVLGSISGWILTRRLRLAAGLI